MRGKKGGGGLLAIPAEKKKEKSRLLRSISRRERGKRSRRVGRAAKRNRVISFPWPKKEAARLRAPTTRQKKEGEDAIKRLRSPPWGGEGRKREKSFPCCRSSGHGREKKGLSAPAKRGGTCGRWLCPCGVARRGRCAAIRHKKGEVI